MRQTAALFCLCYLWFCSEKSFLQLTLPLLQPVLTSVSLCHLECIHPVPLVAIFSTCGSAACTATSGPEHAPTVHRDRLLATMHVLSLSRCHRVSEGCLNSPALIIAASPRHSYLSTQRLTWLRPCWPSTVCVYHASADGSAVRVCLTRTTLRCLYPHSARIAQPRRAAQAVNDWVAQRKRTHRRLANRRGNPVFERKPAKSRSGRGPK